MQYVTFDQSKLISPFPAIFSGYHVAPDLTDTIVNIHDGIDNTGPIVFHIDLQDREDQSTPWIDVPFNTGIYVDVVYGVAKGCILVS